MKHIVFMGKYVYNRVKYNELLKKKIESKYAL
jgi:hypothetical protein